MKDLLVVFSHGKESGPWDYKIRAGPCRRAPRRPGYIGGLSRGSHGDGRLEAAT